MRRSYWMVAPAVLALGGLAACEAAPDGAVGPEITAGPSMNGATVERFSTLSFILIFDPARQLLAAHMPSDLCTPDGAFNVVDVQRVLTPSDLGQRAAKLSGIERIAVYHAASPADAGLAAPINSFGFGNLVDVGTFCAFLAGPTRIAEGPADRISTFSLASFHLKATGTLQGVDGGAYRLTEVYQLNADVDDPANPATFTEPVIRIELTPVE